jgi:hypothetical protein
MEEDLNGGQAVLIYKDGKKNTFRNGPTEMFSASDLAGTHMAIPLILDTQQLLAMQPPCLFRNE